MKRFGFTASPRLPGNPLTEKQLIGNRHFFWKLLLLGFALFVGGLLGFIVYRAISGAVASGVAEWVLGAITVSGQLLLGGAVIGLERGTSLSPLWPGHCLKMAEWCGAYPAVQAHVQAINSQGRPLVECDYSYIEGWVEEQEGQAWLASAQAACKSLNGM